MQSTFRYDVHSGNAGDTVATAGDMEFQFQGVAGLTRIIEISVWDQPAMFSMSYDALVWGPEIEIDQDDPPIQIPHAARQVRIRNAIAGNVSRYQIIGFW